MLTARIIFSEDGTLLEQDYPNIVVGDNDTTVIKISFKDSEGNLINLQGLTLDCVIIRPDGSKSPSLTMSVDYNDRTVGLLLIGNWITEIAGKLLFTFRLRNPNVRALSGTDAPLKATGITTLVVGDGNQPADATITDAQLKALQDAIAANADNILTNKDDIDALGNDKLDKVVVREVVYTNDENGIPSFLKYSVAPIKNKKTVAVRGENGRLQIEYPEEPKDAVNKDYFDYFETFNKIGLLAVGPYNADKGTIKFVYDADIIDENDITYNGDTGILTSKFPKEGYIGGR